MFQPHQFQPTLHGVPKIKITQECAEDMWHLVQVVPTEVGWFCVCHESDDGDITLSEVLLPGQTCTSVETEFSIEGMEQLANEILDADQAAGIDPEDEKFRYNHLNCWNHSHGTMGVGPSGQDDKQMVEFCKHWGDVYPFYLRGIFNQKGDIQFTIYYKVSKAWRKICDVPWEVCGTTNPTRREYWKDLVKQRVNTPKPRAVSASSYGAGAYLGAGKRWSRRI